MLFHHPEDLGARQAFPVVVKIVFGSLQLIGVHLRVPDKDHPVFSVAFVHQVVDGDIVVVLHFQSGILEEEGVDDVVEVVGPQLLEVAGGGGRLEELGAEAGKDAHGSAAVDQEDDPDGVAPRLSVADLEEAALAAGLLDGRVDVKFLLAGLQLGGQVAQDPEGHLELPGVQGVVLAEIPEFAGARRYDGAAAAA